MLKSWTPLPILISLVTAMHAADSIDGTGNKLLAAEAGRPPTQQLVQANSDFAIDLYQQLAKENTDKNLFFSPYSITSALAMTTEGARGETAEQMGRVLRFPAAARRVGDDAQLIPWETSQIHAGMASLNRRFTSGGEETAEALKIRARIAMLRRELPAAKQRIAQLQKLRDWQSLPAAVEQEKAIVDQLNKELSKVDQYEIRIANALWGEKTYPFRQEFIDTVNRHYRTGGVFPVDYRTNHEAARLRINRWVENQTNDRIEDLIPKRVLNEYTRLVLTNAIYFKGEWAKPFDAKLTQEEDFTLANGDKVKTPLMIQSSYKTARYAAFNADGSFFQSPATINPGQTKGLYPATDGFSMAELPYKGDELSMVVIAPNDPAGLPNLESKLTSANLTTWLGHLRQRYTHVYLPKFRLETAYTLGNGGRQPSGTLPQMGMVRAFTDPRIPERGAQFDGMCASADPGYRLYITKVLHKAFLDVNEKGTEAAAATAVVMAVAVSAQITYPFIPAFKADRPFLYLIRDKSSGSILFLGRVMDPTTAK